VPQWSLAEGEVKTSLCFFLQKSAGAAKRFSEIKSEKPFLFL
jgi:hypothetical protein